MYININFCLIVKLLSTRSPTKDMIKDEFVWAKWPLVNLINIKIRHMSPLKDLKNYNSWNTTWLNDLWIDQKFQYIFILIKFWALSQCMVGVVHKALQPLVIWGSQAAMDIPSIIYSFYLVILFPLTLKLDFEQYFLGKITSIP